MKFNSNFSHAKTAKTVKSIGKVLLPVVLLLVAILAISISASAATPYGICADCDEAYDLFAVTNAGTHILKCSNGHYLAQDCTAPLGVPACSESKCVLCEGIIPAGSLASHNWASETDYAGRIPAPESLKALAKNAKCVNGATYYAFCLDCGAFSTNEIRTFNYHVFDKKVANDSTLTSETGICGQPMQFYYTCACGKKSYEVADCYNSGEVFTSGGRVYGHSYIADATAIVAKAGGVGLSADDIIVSGLPCGGDAVYRVFCEFCGDLNGDTVKGTTTGDHVNKASYNNEYHISSCIYCGKIASMAKHVIAEDAAPNCTTDVKCSCGFVAEKKLGHKWEKVEAKEATCDANGTKAYWICTREGCSIGGNKYTNNDGKTVYQDNFTDKGYKILAKGHVAAEGTTACNPGNCTVCGKAITKAAHVFPEGTNCDDKCEVCQNVRRAHEYTKSNKNSNKCGDEEPYATWTECKHCGKVKEGSVVTYKACQYKAADVDINCVVTADKKCVNCGKVAGEIKEFHQLPAGFDAEKVLCTTAYSCAKCGQRLDLEYDWHEIEIRSAVATCTKPGFDSQQYCSNYLVINGVVYPCTLEGAKVNEKAAKGHKLVVDEAASSAADCKNAGKLVYVCEVCGNTEMTEAEIEALTTVIPVNPDKHVIVTRFTAEKHWTECTVCGLLTDAVAHTWKNGKAADCENGAICTACNYSVTALDHQYEKDSKYKYSTNKDGHKLVCQRCGFVDDDSYEAHISSTVATIAAKACATGLKDKKECKVCKYVINAGTVIPMTGDGTHTWVWQRCDKDGKNADTKTKNTYHIQKCTVCNKTQNKAACTDDGKQSCSNYGSCKVCKQPLLKANTTTQSKPILGHSFTKNSAIVATKDGHGYKCDRCDIVAVEAHDVDAKDATCSAAAKCSVCNYVVAEKIAHTWADDLSADNYGHFYACTVCGEKKDYESHKKAADYVRDCTVINKCTVCDHAIGVVRETHDMEYVRGVAATATMDGYTSHDACKYCDYKVGFEVIPATGTQGGDTPAQPGNALDFDGDGDVDEDDAVNIFIEILCGSTEPAYDYNKDGKVDIKDAFAILLSVIMA